MATVIFIKEGRQNRSAMRAVINYCQQEYKTFDSESKRRLVSGVNCDGENAFREFMATKKVYGKDNGIFFYHYAQSFSPSEKLTPEQAHEIALEFAEKAWVGHEVLVTTHCDATHVHSHFVINSVGFESGMKLRQTPSTLKKLRKLSDEICIAHGLSALQPYEGGGKRLSTREYRARMKGESWKQKLANDIDKAMEYSGSKDEFIRSMSILGYHMTWTDERKYLTFHCPNGKSCRDIKLHDEKYLKENIERELLQREFPDSSSGEKQSTGWEDSRELYEQHLRERALTKAESQGVADSYPTVIGNVGSLAGAVSKIVSLHGESDFSGIKNYFNDFYARDTSKKIRAVIHSKGERGERISTTVPYGYMRSPDNPKDWIPDPETAPIVKEIFDLYASGIGIHKICTLFAEHEVVCPSVYAFKKTGKRSGHLDLNNPYQWTITTIRRMLSNRFYVGDTVNFKTYSKSNKLKKRIKNEPENILIFENTHEAIIDRKTFDIVQKHFKGRKRPDAQGNMDKYAGYLYCGDCGKRMYLHRSKTMPAEKNYFQCGGYQQGKSRCTVHNIKEQVLDTLVLAQLKSMISMASNHSDEFYAIATEKGKAEAKKYYDSAEKEKSQLTARLHDLDNIIRCLYEDRVVGRITPERYDFLASGYEEEQAQIRTKLNELNEKINEIDLQEKYVKEFIAKAKEYINIEKLTPEILRAFIKRIDVYEKEVKYSHTCGNTIVIQYTFQLDKN